MATLHEQTAEKISAITAARNTIRNKLIELGLATSTDLLDKLAAAVESIVDQGAVTAQVQEGETYTIPKGFHNGNGTVSGVAGGGNYNLQSKTVTPTKQQQAVTPDSGYYGLSDVKVSPIPDAYQDVTSVTAEQGHVLAGKVLVLADGRVVTGTMANNGSVKKVLDAETISYTLEVGYYTGGTISIVLEEKNATPTKSAQTITPTAGKVLSKVTVDPIPDEYQDVTPVTAEAGDVLSGKTIVSATGAPVDGTMPDNGSVTKTLDGTSASYTIPAGKHSGEGKVSITPETKTATPNRDTQNVTPSAGKVLTKVVVNPIPDNYVDKTGAQAINLTIDPLTQDSVTIPEGYTLGGNVTMTDDLYKALAAI